VSFMPLLLLLVAVAVQSAPGGIQFVLGAENRHQWAVADSVKSQTLDVGQPMNFGSSWRATRSVQTSTLRKLRQDTPSHQQVLPSNLSAIFNGETSCGEPGHQAAGAAFVDGQRIRTNIADGQGKLRAVLFISCILHKLRVACQLDSISNTYYSTYMCWQSLISRPSWSADLTCLLSSTPPESLLRMISSVTAAALCCELASRVRCCFGPCMLRRGSVASKALLFRAS
jgi:hypothetical protein